MSFLFDKIFLANKINRMNVNILDIENSKDGILSIKFSEIIEEFNKEVPITANLVISSLDKNYINITGDISAKLNLKCDRCFKDFTENFSIEIDEMFVKNELFEEYKEEMELKEGNFVEELHGAEEIDITDLIYQSVILNIPNKLVCDINCIGDEKIEEYSKKETSDPRLEIFKSIKIEKDN